MREREERVRKKERARKQGENDGKKEKRENEKGVEKRKERGEKEREGERRKERKTYLSFQKTFYDNVRCNFHHFVETHFGFSPAIFLTDVAKSVE